MIGTGGTSPFGAYGYNPQGIRIGQDKGRNKSAVKVWDQRAYKDYDDTKELGTRNIKVALRRLRRFAREGSARARPGRHHPQHRGQCRHAGHQDGARAPQQGEGAAADGRGRHDGRAHPPRGGALLATKTEFKHLEFYYFHNCVYDFMWKNNRRRFSEKFRHLGRHPQVQQGLQAHLRGRRHDEPVRDPAARRQRRIQQRGAGRRMAAAADHAFPKYAWINPEPQGVWQYRQSISIVQQLINQRMFPLTLAGLEGAMRLLSK
jgi:uncharacterized protein with von Willebrand factor type A (vWA) domain